jgi:hypothetical protein
VRWLTVIGAQRLLRRGAGEGVDRSPQLSKIVTYLFESVVIARSALIEIVDLVNDVRQLLENSVQPPTAHQREGNGNSIRDLSRHVLG